MRVLFVNENLGGHATLHLHLARALEQRDDVQAEFLHVPAPRLARRVVGASVPGLARWDADLQPARAKLAAAAWVRRRLRDRAADFDVVHFYSHNSALLARDAVAGRPWVVSTDSTNEINAVTLHYRDPGRFTAASTRLIRRFEDPVIAEATSVVAHSAFVARSLSQDYGRTDVPVIPFGIMPPEASVRRETPTTPVITFIGKTMAGKGGDLLLRAFARLSRPAELVLVTRESVSPRPGVTVINDLTPGDPRLSEVLSRTTVLAMPSKVDTFGYASLEAMAHGAAVVASTVGAHDELIVDGETGLLVEPDDEDALVAALDLLVGDPGRAAAMGAAGRERFAERFDARTTTAALLDVLHDAAGTRRS